MSSGTLSLAGQECARRGSIDSRISTLERPWVATCLQVWVGIGQSVVGWVRGLLGVVGTLLLENILPWGGLESILILIMGEGTQALSAAPRCQLLRGDELEKPGQLLIEV